MHETQALLAAVNTLISTDQHTFMREAVEAVIAMRSRYPVVFEGKLATLNPLVKLHGEDPVSYDRVRELIDTKRAREGSPPLWPDPEQEKFDKVEYQRQLMATRRRIARIALDIENAQRRERDRLIGSARLEFENKVLSEWGAELEKRLDALREQAGGRLTKEVANNYRKNYWRQVEDSLEERREQLRLELLKPAHLRRKV